jgi:hypothetical protein
MRAASKGSHAVAIGANNIALCHLFEDALHASATHMATRWDFESVRWSNSMAWGEKTPPQS